MLGIWLALAPLVVVQSWQGRKRKRRGMPWYVLLLVAVAVSVGGLLAGCGTDRPTSTPRATTTKAECFPDSIQPETPPVPTPYDIIITTVDPPGIREAILPSYDGEPPGYRFDWGVVFEVDRPLDPSPPSGFFVQKVTYTERYWENAEKTGPPNESTETFYENFVSGLDCLGKVDTGQNTTGRSWDDNYNYVMKNNTRGELIVEGLVRFYEYDGEVMPGLERYDLVARAHNYYSSYHRPEWWEDDASGTVHNLTFEWDTFAKTSLWETVPEIPQ
jgi:hypothetical protein